MILILGGTTEGRKAVQVVESAGKPYYYSTVGNEQAIEAVHATPVVWTKKRWHNSAARKKSRC